MTVMKVVLIIAAMLLAATSVAAAALRSCNDGGAAAMAATYESDCADGALTGEKGRRVACDFAALCAIFCGVVPPDAPATALAADLYSLAFLPASTILHDASLKPEPPPPRFRSH